LNAVVSGYINSGSAIAALTLLNSAITAVAAQDGYIGAKINTLNAVSQALKPGATLITPEGRPRGRPSFAPAKNAGKGAQISTGMS
jgi:hypothetical protein